MESQKKYSYKLDSISMIDGPTAEMKSSNIHSTASIDSMSTDQHPTTLFGRIKFACTKHVSARNLYVWTLLTIYIWARAIDRLLNQKWIKSMPTYNFLASVLNPALVGPFLWLIYLYFRCIKQTIPLSKRNLPKWMIIGMSFLDSLNYITSGWATPFLTMSMQNVLQQTTLVFVMIASFVFLKRRYTGYHYIGAFLIIYAVMVSVMGIFDGESIEVSVNGVVVPISALYVVIFILSNVFMAASKTCKEKVLKKYDCDVYFLTAWIITFQFIISVLIFPAILTPLPEPAERVPPAGLGNYLKNGFKCFAGYATEGVEDKCNTPWLWALLYSFFNITFNLLLLLLVKHTSAVATIVADGAVTALSSLLSLSPTLMGENSQDISPPEAFALILSVAAIFIYNAEPEKDIHGNYVLGADDQTANEMGYDGTHRKSSVMCPTDRRRSSVMSRI
eukprot:Nk52_evm7s217 gene=Nk52_evmTU7s217